MKRIFTHIEDYESVSPVQMEMEDMLLLCRDIHVGIGDYQNIVTFFITESEWYETILSAPETRHMAQNTLKNIRAEVI